MWRGVGVRRLTIYMYIDAAVLPGAASKPFYKHIQPRHRKNTARGTPMMTKRIGATTGTILLLASAALINFVRGSVDSQAGKVNLLSERSTVVL